MSRAKRAEISFFGLGAVAIVVAGVLAASSSQFAARIALSDQPILAFVATMIVAGGLVSALAQRLPTVACQRQTVAVMLAVGLVMRLIMMVSTPILENDYHRYLWDGAVVSAGLNPYEHSPEAATAQPDESAIGHLARTGRTTIDAIGYPQLRTLYPPVAELAFAIASRLAPFNLTAWRIVVLAGELATICILLALLKAAGRSMLWASLYWWNPLVVKELTNSGHMEAVLLPFMLLALLLAVRNRPGLAAVALSAAAGVKLWPVLLLPLLVRASPAAGWRTVGVFTGMTVLWALPYAAAATGEDAGLIAYAQDWQTFSALMAVLQSAGDVLSAPFFAEAPIGDVLARLAVVGAAILTALALAWPPIRAPLDLIERAGLVVVAIFLLSPSQFPWYALWWLPFLPFLPWPSLLALNLTMPLYYLAFFLMARDARSAFEGVVIWVAWLPIWPVLVRDGWNYWRHRNPARGP